MRRGSWILLLIIAATCAAASADRLTAEAIVSMRTLDAMAIRPDGSAVAYVVGEPTARSQEAVNAELWLAAGDGPGRRLTENPGPDSSPQWSPDGAVLAFLSARPGDSGRQIYVFNELTGKARRLTTQENGIAAYAWAPQGRRIAYLCPRPLTADEKRRKESGDDEMVFTESDHDRHAAPNRVWILDTVKGTSSLVDFKPETAHVSGVVWSRDGKRLLLTVSDQSNMDHEWIRSRLMVAPAAGGEAAVWCPPPGKFQRPRWAPDGTVTFLGSSEARDPSAGVFYRCAMGSAPVPVTMSAPFTIAAYEWMPDRTVLATIIEKNWRRLARLNPETGTVSWLSEPGRVISPEFSITPDGKRMACGIETPHRPADIWWGQPASDLRQLTHLNPALERLTYGETEDLEWTAADGLAITGVLIKPVGYQAGQRYPLIVQPHGGPESVDLNGFQIAWGQYFAAHGYAVLFPNFRGSIGRGARYALESNRSFGVKDLPDILAGVDELVRRGIADPERLGIGGWSYGGFMAAWAITQTNRFKAAVMGVGVSDWYSLMGETPLPQWTVQVHFETWPYDAPQEFRGKSPLEFVKNARTPTLILHGEVDPMIPLSQAKEFFRALRRYDVPSEMVVYPREGHGLREPMHRRRAYARVIAWYDRYLKGTAKKSD